MSVCPFYCLGYPACKSRVFYSALILSFVSCLTVPHFFPHYVINGTIFFKKKLLNIKFVLFRSTYFVCNISHSKRN